ncbi:GNAT family N-acetyltransferase [Pradoshia eiseniae]|uniref:GNAT family N-acetyltransferase n=1 Tax=Pradoshia eiseniae TaxID=2064768 RepID=A0A2S7N3V8_9BACI|nr:GNAT family N-acetyltransferase [Pradoshia eiseniae]PQD96707.1 GNAT family N-acetyltransferase [Pradoshia eiseniae]
MIEIKLADLTHVKGIQDVCSRGYRATYPGLRSKDYIEKVIEEFYNQERITKEVTEHSRHWGGYFVAVENGQVIGAAGGGMESDTLGELYVLYLDPNRRGEGIGTLLLDAVTAQQKEWGATEQRVAVAKDNQKAIPFYEARGFRFLSEKESYFSAKQEGYVTLHYIRQI